MSVHHRTIQINHQPHATIFQFIILTFIVVNNHEPEPWTWNPDVCLHLKRFRSRPSSGAQWLQWQPLVLPLYRDDIRAVFVVGPASRWNMVVAVLLVVIVPIGPDHDQQHCYHHVPKANRRRLLQFISSWWWAWGCPKYVELRLNYDQ
jgi:hypothetical protein